MAMDKIPEKYRPMAEKIAAKLGGKKPSAPSVTSGAQEPTATSPAGAPEPTASSPAPLRDLARILGTERNPAVNRSAATRPSSTDTSRDRRDPRYLSGQPAAAVHT